MTLRRIGLRRVLSLTIVLAGSIPASAHSSEAHEGFPDPPPASRRMRQTDDFNPDYLYAITRSVADSSLHTGAVVALAPLTVAIDTALLPIAALMGIIDHY
jgi:hypothetical protein